MTVAANMELHPNYGFWKEFAFSYPDLKCAFCTEPFIVEFREAKRWQNLSQHLTRVHPKELSNGDGLQPVDFEMWKNAQQKQ